MVFTARTEGFIHGRPDMDETIRRLKAFADAGADCLYAPGIKTREQIASAVKAVAPKPINFLNSGAFGFTVNDLAALGVRRISVGGTLARVAMHAFIKSATEIAKEGKFDSFAGIDAECRTQQFLQPTTARKDQPDDKIGTSPEDRPAGWLARRAADAGHAPRPGDAARPLRPAGKTQA